MKSFDYTTTEDFEGTRFGAYLLTILQRLELSVPRIKGFILKKMHKEGIWGIKALQPRREDEETIVIKVVSDTIEKGINLVMQDWIGCLCGRYYTELSDHYSILFGRRDVEGEPYDFEAAYRGKAEYVCKYLQDLEYLVTELHEDRRDELFKTNELCSLLKEIEEKVKDQDEECQALEEKFQKQEKKYKNKEKRVQRNNKEIREMKMELESNEVELEADSDLIKRLHAEKRELQEKNSTLEQEVKDLKKMLDQEGYEIEEVEEVDEDSMIEG